jgi:hypothetical protein
MMPLPLARLRFLSFVTVLVGFGVPGFAHAAILGTDEFARLDANKDGVVSAAENAAGTRAIFRQADANRDDVLTVTELAVAEERKASREARDTTTPRKSVSAGLRDAAEQIKVVDENGDGEATAAELVAGAQQRFALMDVNQDGYLDRAECEAGAAS